jgi:hypothetical protein
MKRPKKPIIGLCGYARTGKDTMAAAVTCEPLSFMRFAFADELKSDVSEAMLHALIASGQHVDSIDVSRVMSGQKEKIRPMLVGWGAGMRAVDSDHWIKRLTRIIHARTLFPCDSQYGKLPRLTSRCVITDVRYLNEADWVRSLGGIVVWIERPGVFAANDEELFKTLPDYCDVRLILDGSIEENQAKFCKIAEDWLDQCRRDSQGDHDAETH